MKSFLRKYPSLSFTIALLALVSFLFLIGSSLTTCATVLVLGQLAMFSLAAPARACYIAALTQEQINEFERAIDEMKARMSQFSGPFGTGVRYVGNVPFVTDDCAKALTANFVIQCARTPGMLAAFVKDEARQKSVVEHAVRILRIDQKTALTGTEIPLPIDYIPQVVELVFRFGAARQYATVLPLGAGVTKLPRLRAGEDDFGYLGAGTAGMSQPVPEKRVTAELVTFTANKAGGLIRLPFELEQDTFIPIGQFLARYAARQFAKLEDRTLFLADGTATYASQTGVGPYCAANTDYLLTLAAGKTKGSDITLDDLRKLRGLVNPAVVGDTTHDAAYYMSSTYETLLSSFNKYPNFVVFKNENGKATLDGWPVRWLSVGQANNNIAAPSTFPVFFGALNYWYLGERGGMRFDVSREYFFNTDEVALRALERIDVEAMAIDAMAALQLGAAS